MGIFPCPMPCQTDEEFDHSNQDIQSDSSSNSLSSQSSLPSVPSLTSSNPQPSDQSATVYHHCEATLKGHSSYVFSLALAGKHLYSGSSGSEIRSWSRHPSASNNESPPLLAAGKSAVKSLVVFGNKLISAHQDHKIRVWNIEKEGSTSTTTRLNCLVTLPKLNDRITRIFSAKNYVEVRRHKKCTWVHHVDAISALALSPDGSTLYSASWDRTFKVWRTSDFSCMESLWNAHDDAINAIVVSADGFVYTGSADHKIKVWRKEVAGQKKHALVGMLEKHKSAVNALALSADGNILYSGACDRSIIVWERNNGGGVNGGHLVVAGALRGNKKAILCLDVVGDLVCSGSADKTVRVWRRESIGKSYSCLAVMEGHRGPVKCLTAAVDSGGDEEPNNSSSSGKSYLVYSGSLDCDIKIWKLWVPFN